MKQIKFILIVVLLAVAGFISWRSHFTTYVQKDTVDIHQFPRTIKNWQSEELKITEQEYAILETRNAFARRYFTEDGKEVLLYIIYSQTNRKIAHPPELCYTGDGQTVLLKAGESLVLTSSGERIDFQKVLFEKDGVKQIVTYFFKVGNAHTSSYLYQQFLIALKSLTGQSASSAMVRVSAMVQNRNPEQTLDDIKIFMDDIYTLLPKYLL